MPGTFTEWVDAIRSVVDGLGVFLMVVGCRKFISCTLVNTVATV